MIDCLLIVLLCFSCVQEYKKVLLGYITTTTACKGPQMQSLKSELNTGESLFFFEVSSEEQTLLTRSKKYEKCIFCPGSPLKKTICKTKNFRPKLYYSVHSSLINPDSLVPKDIHAAGINRASSLLKYTFVTYGDGSLYIFIFHLKC